MGSSRYVDTVVSLALDDDGAKVGAYVMSALAFATIHLFPPALPFYLLYGLGLAAIYDRTRSLAAPILAHATVNVAAVVQLLT